MVVSQHCVSEVLFFAYVAGRLQLLEHEVVPVVDQSLAWLASALQSAFEEIFNELSDLFVNVRAVKSSVFGHYKVSCSSWSSDAQCWHFAPGDPIVFSLLKELLLFCI